MNADEPTSGLERLVWEKAPIPALICAPDGQCLDANKAATDFFDQCLADLKQCSLSSFCDEGSQLIVDQVLGQCLGNCDGDGPVAIDFDRVDGTVKCLVSLQCLEGAGEANMPNSVLVQIQEIPLDEIFHTSSPDSKLHYTNDAIFILDLNRRLQFWNAGCERVFGWNHQETIGSEITEFIFDGNPEVLSLLGSIPDIEHWSGELGVETKSGDHRKIELRLNLLQDKDGKHDGVLAIVADITEKHALEECYVRAQRLESLSTLAAGVAHDLNNVFTPVTMAVELLRSVDLPPDELEDLLETVDGSIERGSAIIKQLVAFGKGAEGKNIVFQPKHLIREVVNIIQKTLPQGIEIQSEVLRESWVICGDQIQFHQLLMNLFLNARDAMPNGGKIQIRTDNVTIDEHFPSIDIDLEPGRYIQVTVEDDGEGMDKEVQEKVFEPFFTTRPVGRGSGLGLTNVLGIVKSFNGFIQCQSQPGQGSKFEVFLPAVFENESEHPTYDPSDRQGNGETILIVDDEEAVRDTTQKLLVQNGYKTLKAVDGVDAISVYGRNQDQVKIVITDLKMPNMDGISLVRILRNMNPDLPVLVVSGHPDEHDTELIEPYSSIHFLEKPHKSVDLLHWVHHLLHQDEVQV